MPLSALLEFENPVLITKSSLFVFEYVAIEEVAIEEVATDDVARTGGLETS